MEDERSRQIWPRATKTDPSSDLIVRAVTMDASILAKFPHDSHALGPFLGKLPPEVLAVVVKKLGWFRTTFAMAGKTCREVVERAADEPDTPNHSRSTIPAGSNSPASSRIFAIGCSVSRISVHAAIVGNCVARGDLLPQLEQEDQHNDLLSERDGLDEKK